MHRSFRARLLPRALVGVLRRHRQQDPRHASQIAADELLFDRDFYLAANPDVAAAGLDPQQHFLLHGLAESRDPHPLVDIAHLRSQAGDSGFGPERLTELLADPLIQPHPRFDVAYYLAENPDVAEAGLAPLRHYIEHGAVEGRSPCPGFDPDWYLQQHPEAGTDRYQAFVHFARVGHAHGFMPGPRGVPAANQGGSRRTAPGPQGVLDGADQLVASGWAYSPDAPAGGAVIEIMDGDRVVGRGTATQFRRDLEGLGYGDAHCGFSIPLSRSIADGRSHRLRARFADGSFLHGEIDVHAPQSGDLPFDPLPREELAGAAERISVGWDGERQQEFRDVCEEAALLLESGQHDAASRVLHGIDDRFLGNPLSSLLRSLAQIGLGRGDLALDAARVALGDAALAPWAWLAIGNASRMLGRWTDAGDAFRQAGALRPDLRLVGIRLDEVEERAASIEARRQLAAGDRAAALKAVVPALIRYPKSARLQELALKAMDAPPEEDMPAGVHERQALRSIALLGGVVDYLRNRRVDA